MTTGRRHHYAEVLRRARDEHTLVLAALGNIVRPGSRGVGQRAMDLQREELSNIAVALEQVKVGSTDFGRCEICGEDVEDFRLDVEPWTRRCLTHVALSLGD